MSHAEYCVFTLIRASFSDNSSDEYWTPDSLSVRNWSWVFVENVGTWIDSSNLRDWIFISSDKPGLRSPILKLSPSMRFRRTPTTNFATRAVKNSIIAQLVVAKSTWLNKLRRVISFGNDFPAGTKTIFEISPYGWKKP